MHMCMRTLVLWCKAELGNPRLHAKGTVLASCDPVLKSIMLPHKAEKTLLSYKQAVPSI